MSQLEQKLNNPEARRFKNDQEIRKAIEDDPTFRNQLRVWIEMADKKTPSPTERVHRRQLEEANAGAEQ